MSDTIQHFAEGFLSRSETDWRPLAEKALRGAGFDETLSRSTSDGLTRGPAFFTRPDNAGAVDARTKDLFLPWGMRQTLLEATPETANTAALDDLMGGVSELELRLDPDGHLGLRANELDTLDTALKGVDLSLAPIHLDCLAGQGHHAHLMLTLLARRRVDGETLEGGLGLSPVERAARTGDALDAQSLPKARDLAELAQAAFPRLKIFRADAALAFEAGGTEAQELAFMAASAATYMRIMLEAGLDADAAAGAIELRLAADTDIHLTIAKLRAARRIFGQIAASFGASTTTASIQAVTAARMLSAQDPWTNLIRNACAGFAAAAGGADAITIRPLTEAIGRPTSFGRRVARNLHILLAEESHIGKVTDPAAGSYLHENLSNQLAETAWSLFQDIEGRGGLAAVLANGWLQDEIAKTRAAKLEAITKGEDLILGVTKYPDPDPKAVEVGQAWPDQDINSTALPPINLAAAFEGDA